jgi:tetratricopeptide (TPR) repeat protein
LRRAGRPDVDVFTAYKVGANALHEGINSVSKERAQLESIRPPLSGDAAEFLYKLVESCGALGGLQQRMSQLEEALASYSAGAALEEKFALPSTYNRLNKIKQTLLTGHDSLHALEPQIGALGGRIETALREDQTLSDSGWAWADLGDCLALLGRTEDAGRAYATFIAKAEIKSPERTLDVLKQIASTLQARGDPDAVRLQAAIEELQSRLAAR